LFSFDCCWYQSIERGGGGGGGGGAWNPLDATWAAGPFIVRGTVDTIDPVPLRRSLYYKSHKNSLGRG
jgi:hypothetical protein